MSTYSRERYLRIRNDPEKWGKQKLYMRLLRMERSEHFRKYEKDWVRAHPDYNKGRYRKLKSDPVKFALHKAKILEHHRKRLALIARLKMRPCADCGFQHNPWVMQFDHRDPSKKLHLVSHMSMNKFEAEAAKCDVVCANCHSERTHTKRKENWDKFINPKRSIN